LSAESDFHPNYGDHVETIIPDSAVREAQALLFEDEAFLDALLARRLSAGARRL